MVDPSQFDSVIDWSFAIATCIYTIIGATGYLMFGNDVSDEVSHLEQYSILHQKTDLCLLVQPGFDEHAWVQHDSQQNSIVGTHHCPSLEICLDSETCMSTPQRQT
jgi:hypothetical protein